MDVKCEKCGTEYEFDDAKVTEAGITVKCTHCGHLFRVIRQSVVFDESPVIERGESSHPPAAVLHWMIRGRGGEIREFKDLDTLRQWIVERKVSRDDEISKTGESWKPLSSIVELSGLFGEVEVRGRRPADEPSSAPARASDLSGSHTLTPSPGPAPPPPRGSDDLLETDEFRLEGPAAARRLAGRSARVEGRSGQRPGEPPAPPPLPPEARPEVFVHRSPSPAPLRRLGGISGTPPAVRPMHESTGAAASAPPAFSTGGRTGLPPSRTGEYPALSGAAHPYGGPSGVHPLPPHPTGPYGYSGGFSAQGGHPYATGQMPAMGPGYGPPTGPLTSGMYGTPMPGGLGGPTPTPYGGFDGEAPHYGTASRRGGLVRGFLVGMLVSVATAGVVYFVWDNVFRERPALASSRQARGTVVAAQPSAAPEPERATTADPRALVLLERARVAHERDTAEGFGQARAHLDELVERLGDPPQNLELAARAQIARARAAIAEAEYIKVAGGDTSSLMEMAELALAAAESVAPGRPDARLAYADFYRVSGQPADSQRALAEAEKGGISGPEAELMRATARLHVDGGHAEVVEALNAQPTATLGLPRARYLHAVALERSGQPDAAIKVLLELLAINRAHTPAKAMLDRLGATEPGAAPAKVPEPPEPAEAQRAVAAKVEPAPRVSPSPVAAVPRPVPAVSAPAPTPAPAAEPAGLTFEQLLSRGSRLAENGRPAEARKLFEQAVALRPANAEVWTNLGWCDYELGATRSAIGNFQKALGRSPRYAPALYGLGLAHQKAGQRAEAASAYQDYLRYHPEGNLAKSVREKLARLQ